MSNKGILLLNASLVYRKNKVNYDARQWRPFILSVLSQLALKNADIQLILLGRIAGAMDNTGLVAGLIAEHPYNISFITNPNVLKFFKPLDLLRCYEN
jgi:uracil-DNA glycosylase